MKTYFLYLFLIFLFPMPDLHAQVPESAFLDTIRDDPEADGPRLVYADWLEQKGYTAKAKLIRKQVEAAHLRPNDPKKAELDQEAEVIIAENWQTWVAHYPEWCRRRVGKEDERLHKSSGVFWDRGLPAIHIDADSIDIKQVQESDATTAQQFMKVSLTLFSRVSEALLQTETVKKAAILALDFRHRDFYSPSSRVTGDFPFLKSVCFMRANTHALEGFSDLFTVGKPFHNVTKVNYQSTLLNVASLQAILNMAPLTNWTSVSFQEGRVFRDQVKRPTFDFFGLSKIKELDFSNVSTFCFGGVDYPLVDDEFIRGINDARGPNLTKLILRGISVSDKGLMTFTQGNRILKGSEPVLNELELGLAVLDNPDPFDEISPPTLQALATAKALDNVKTSPLYIDSPRRVDVIPQDYWSGGNKVPLRFFGEHLRKLRGGCFRAERAAEVPAHTPVAQQELPNRQ